jgi:hypothetical protein
VEGDAAQGVGAGASGCLVALQQELSSAQLKRPWSCVQGRAASTQGTRTEREGRKEGRKREREETLMPLASAHLFVSLCSCCWLPLSSLLAAGWLAAVAAVWLC